MLTKNNTISRIFTTLLIIYPLLGMYSMFGSPIMLPDFLMILLLAFITLRACFIKSVAFETSFLPWTIYIIIHMLATLLLRNVSNTNDFIGSTLRYLIYLIAILLGTKNYFDVDYAIKLYKYVCVISTAFLILQTIVVALFGYYIKGYLDISFLPISRSDLYGFGTNVSQYAIFRPRSFFSEPAHYGSYICGFLTISLFRNGKKELPVQLFLSLGALLSMSSTAILIIIVIWAIYFYVNFSWKISYRTLLMLLFVPIILLFVIRSEYFQVFIYRLFETNSAQNRFNGYENIMKYFDGKMSMFLLGYGNGGLQFDGVYLAGYGRLLVYYGLVGAIVYLINMLYSFSKGAHWQKILLIVMLILAIGEDSFFNNIILCRLPFVCSTKYQNNGIKNISDNI